MNKSKLIAIVAEKTVVSKSDVKQVVNTMFEAIAEALAGGNKVKLKGFGTFQMGSRAARNIKNPQTGKLMLVPAATVPQFKAGKRLKNIVNGNSDARKEAKPAGPDTTGSAKKRARQNNARVLAVTSGKGGTGKTNFVINAAISLSRRGLKVCVIDADLGTANVDVLLGVRPRYTLGELVDGTVASIMDILVDGPGGIKLVPGGSGLQSLADLPPEELNRVIDMFEPLEEQSDLIIIDTGSGISRSVIDFAMAADEIVVVVTPEPHSITDAYAIIKVLSSKENHPPIKLVFNLVGNRAEARDASTKMLTVTERFLNLTPQPLGYILKDDNVVRSVKNFQPFVLHNPSTPAARCIENIVDQLYPANWKASPAPMEKTGFFGKLKSFFLK
jgi:flagellar biosynthesis protein FlhG